MIRDFISELFGLKAKDQPQNNLERLFAEAMRRPAARPDFYAALRNATLLVPGSAMSAPSAGMQDFSVAFLDYQGEKVLPVFTTSERLRAVLGPRQEQLSLPLNEICERFAPGAGIALNPYSDFGREFSASELKDILC